MKKKIRMLSSFIAVISVISCVSGSATATFKTDVSTPIAQEKIYVDGVDITVNYNEEISRAIDGKTDLPTSYSNTPIAVVSGDFEAQSVDTYTTTRKIQVQSIEDSISEPIYATTSVAVLSNEKSDSDSVNAHYVTAYITVYWRDNLGPKNDFLGASGGWDVDVDPNTGKKPSLSNRKVTLNAYYDASNWIRKPFACYSNTFNYSESDFDYSALLLMVETYVDIGADDSLEFSVSSGILT